MGAPDGGVAVFGLDGRLRQTLGPIDRPNNVDVEYGLALGGVPTDIAVVAPKAGPADGYLWQYRLEDDGSGRVGARFVRRFGTFSGTGEIEAVAVDDDLGYVYYADETHAIHKWHADPDHVDASKELAAFGTEGYVQDREGAEARVHRRRQHRRARRHVDDDGSGVRGRAAGRDEQYEP